MLDAILDTGPGSVVPVPALLGGKWIGDGPSAERIGPFTRTVVSRARVAEPNDARHAAEYARASARTLARLAPATRASILERAADLATAHREAIARLIALELGKPLKDGRGELDRVADTFAVCASRAGPAESATPR
jgi:acyl-CoA reductase-like NAD-dependent aldehyde dehydrogenase